jgi:hypothetical protein
LREQGAEYKQLLEARALEDYYSQGGVEIEHDGLAEGDGADARAPVSSSLSEGEGEDDPDSLDEEGKFDSDDSSDEEGGDD